MKRRVAKLLSLAFFLSISLPMMVDAKVSGKGIQEVDCWLWCAKKPYTIGQYRWVPKLTPTYFVRSYQIKKNGKKVAGATVGQDGWDRQFGLVLPLVCTNKVQKRDLLAGGRFSKTLPGDRAEKVFGVEIYGEQGKRKAFSPGTDITGDGIPDLIVGYQPEGHSGYTCDVFSLGDKCTKLFQIDGGDNPAYFKDLDGDGACEILIADSTFAYWEAGYCNSAKPRLILRVKDNKPAVATDLMKAPAPTETEIQAIVDRDKQEYEKWATQNGEKMSEHDFTPRVVGTMVNFVYTGNAKAAWKSLDLMWPGKQQVQLEGGQRVAKDKFLCLFKAQLAKSPYWQGLQQLNKGQM